MPDAPDPNNPSTWPVVTLAEFRRQLKYAVPASETPEGKRREQSYYESLGRFVQIFAEVEQVIFQTLWAYAGTDNKVARIVFAGIHSDQAASCIGALATVKQSNAEMKADLTNVLQQFGIIRGARNDILHYGATGIAEGKATVSNAWKAKAEPTEFPIDAEALIKMRDDCRKIIAHLAYNHLGRDFPKSVYGASVLSEVLRRSWRYKHPAKPQSGAKTKESRRARKRDPKRAHPQPASHE